MKKNYILTINRSQLLISISFLVLISSCKKEIELSKWDTYTPSGIDATGGAWKPIVVSHDSVSVAPPDSVNSSNYAAELQSMKNTMASATGDQKEAVSYWSYGAIRWNEIARELVAKYNLAPEASANGTYPFPDATHPSEYPLYPFANPPYASRVYAYLSVAQYDGLVTAWYYKFQYNRPAPHLADPGIVPMIYSGDLPSYPSEDAVIAAASCTILKAMFPLEVDMLNRKLAEHENSRLWAGANVQSDITAGNALGNAIGAKIMARAKADGMGAAKGTQAIWDSLANNISSAGGLAWKSLEVPPRPPQLPLFGNVKNWTFDHATKIALRPLPPPAIGSTEFQTALLEVKDFSKNLTHEQYRIAAYWSDGIGTYTPPGHWNRIACELIIKNTLSQLRVARTLALLNMSVEDAGICCWDTKSFYYLPRPSQMDPDITTAIGLPNFPSYTSGHSTFSGAASTVLGYIFPSEAGDLAAKASEASLSRIYGAIHYRFDCEAGLQCGKNIGQYAVTIGQNDGSPQ
jgi:hypothetical protein